MAFAAIKRKDFGMLRMTRLLKGQHGYTLMEVLIVATIISILLTVGSVSYLEAKRRAKEQYAAQRLSQLAVFEKMYFREFGAYATFEDLRNEGYLAQDYIYEDDEPQHYHRPVYVQDYALDFIIDTAGGGFEIDAKPVLTESQLWYPRWMPLGGIPYLRSLKVDEQGVVMWLENGRPVF
jgi:prepilin-type N-terminal cleavage/methylation domain-containing protein